MMVAVSTSQCLSVSTIRHGATSHMKVIFRNRHMKFLVSYFRRQFYDKKIIYIKAQQWTDFMRCGSASIDGRVRLTLPTAAENSLYSYQWHALGTQTTYSAQNSSI
jgi:hypothetical protein